jgi:nitroimidazol reductase NimA-like FMN-containing flavoprotein (pyridoxamine 5'-phosphate oxidase superfamily)
MPRYHMCRKDREITDPAEMTQILSKGRFATVALCRGDEPYLVALNYGFDPKRNCLYFHCAGKGLKLEFIRANRQACVLVVEDLGYVQTECDHHYRSVVAWGAMVILEDLADKRTAIDTMQQHLEDDPKVVREKMPVGDAALLKVTILRLDIRELTAKKNV